MLFKIIPENNEMNITEILNQKFLKFR